MKEKKLKREIDRLFHKWVPIFRVQDWEWQITYRREFRNPVDEDVNFPKFMVCHASWEYKLFEVETILHRGLYLSPRKVEMTVIHELCHVALAEMRHVSDDYVKHEERVATHMVDILYGMEEKHAISSRASS